MTTGDLVALVAVVGVLVPLGVVALRGRTSAGRARPPAVGVPRRFEVDGATVVVTYEGRAPTIEVSPELAVDKEMAELIAPTPRGWTYTGQVYQARHPPEEAEAIADGVAQVRRLALRLQRAAPLLAEVVERDPDPVRRRTALDVFVREADLGPLRERALAAARVDPDPAIRLRAAIVDRDLGRLEALASAPRGPVAAPAVAALIELAPGSDEAQRAVAQRLERRRALGAEALTELVASLGRVALPWVEPLLQGLAGDADAAVAQAALRALAARRGEASPEEPGPAPASEPAAASEPAPGQPAPGQAAPGQPDVGRDEATTRSDGPG